MKLEKIEEEDHEYALSILLLLKRNNKEGVPNTRFDKNSSLEILERLERNKLILIKHPEDEEDETDYYYHISSKGLDYIKRSTDVFKQDYRKLKE